MRRLAARLWALPWPPRLRRLALGVVSAPGIRFLAFPAFHVGVVGVIRNADGDVLLLRHTYRGRWPWGAPSGFVEHREQPIDAMRREIQEETGFEVELAPTPTLFINTDRPLLNIVFRGTYISGAFVPGPEISEARFFPVHALPPLEPSAAWLLRSVLEERDDHPASARVRT